MLIDQLHEKFPYLTDLRVRDIRVDKSKRKIRTDLSYPNVSSFDPATKSNVTSFVRDCVPKGYFCDVRFFNDYFTELSFRQDLFKYIKSRFPAYRIAKEYTEIHQHERDISVLFNVSQITKNNLDIANFCESLAEHYASYTCYHVSFSLRVDTKLRDVTADQIADQENLLRVAINKELRRPVRCFSVTNVEKYIGKLIKSTKAMYIGDIRGEQKECVLCGRISAKTLKASKTDKTLQICKFTLSDDAGGNIPCIMFVRFLLTDFETLKETTRKPDSEVLTLSRTRTAANDRKMKKLMNIYDGMEVIVKGRIVNNDFSERLEMQVFDMSLCKIEQASALTQISPVPDNYVILKPQRYVETIQTSFGESFFINEKFNSQKFVVLHANVTGTTPTKDKIVSFCAVKIEHGVVLESMFAHVNPEIYVGDELSKLVGMDSNELLYLHTMTELVPDLYKFTYGYQLVGSEIAKLVPMLDYYAEPFGYKFTNTLHEESVLLSSMFEQSTIKKLPNCNKLVDIAKACKIPFEFSLFCKNSAHLIANALVVVAKNFKG